MIQRLRSAPRLFSQTLRRPTSLTIQIKLIHGIRGIHVRVLSPTFNWIYTRKPAKEWKVHPCTHLHRVEAEEGFAQLLVLSNVGIGACGCITWEGTAF